MKLPGSDVEELIKFRVSPEGKKLAAWASSAFANCRSQRTEIQTQWLLNLRMIGGDQYLRTVQSQGQVTATLPSRPKGRRESKRVNRLRSFMRTECSKFQSTFPSVVSVPATAEDEDTRAAYAAEQVWQSMVDTKHLERVYARAIWWMVATGNGFLKQWWDPSQTDENGMPIGDIKFESVSPFHLFVPDLFERELDDQSYIIQAQTRTIDWVKTYYPEELKGVDLNAERSGDGGSSMIDESFRAIQNAPKQKADTVTITEYWVKKGATSLLPEGGLLVFVGETLVAYHPEYPYQHGMLPYSKFEHIATEVFYADSPLVDLIDLQKEYNELRTMISTTMRRMGFPQLLYTEGSLVPSKLTNEAGLAIGVRPGFPMPTPLPLASLPQYVPDLLDRILTDFEDLSGQHDVSRGTAPTGVTAGTALTFLKEIDDSYLTPQYKNVEQGVERTAVQALSLFNQYVDIERKVKVVGKDSSFDVLMLEGSSIASGLDVRVERGSSIGESQAAKQARVLEYFQNQLIDQPTALRLLELGGPQRTLDTLQVAARKANRENLKMKSLDPALIAQNTEQFVSAVVQDLASNPAQLEAMAAEGMNAEQIVETVRQEAPAMIPVDDFDIHEAHLEEHNRYRMSQEFETLPDEIKQEFQKHCAAHENYIQQAMAMQMMMQGGGGGPMGGPGDPTGAPPGPDAMPDTMAAGPEA